MWKFIVGVIVTLLVAVIITFAVGLKNINELVKVAVEVVGTEVMGSQVTLREVDISLMDGRGELRGLTVHNPPGFNTDYLFHLDKTVLQLDVQSLTGKVIVIKEITINGPKVIAEQTELLKTNLQVAWDNMKKSTVKHTDEKSHTAEGAKAESPHHNVRLMVEKFSFNNAQLDLISNEWGARSLTMKPVKAENLGSKAEGLTPENLVKALLKPVIKMAKDQVEDEIKEKLKDKAEDKAKEKLEEKLKDKLSEKDRAKIDELRSLFKR